MQKVSNLSNGFRSIGRGIKLQWEKHGSLICTIGGTAALISSGVHACRKTYKYHDFLAENGKKIEEAKKPIEGEKKVVRIFRVSKAMAIAGGKTVIKYIPEIAGAAVGSYGIGKGWTTEHKHYKEAVAFGSMIFADFMDYRKNVIAEQGEDADRRYLAKKKPDENISESDEAEFGEAAKANGEGLDIVAGENAFRIWYSRETTPNLWSPSLSMRLVNLQWATNEVDRMFIDGYVTANDVRRIFYGRKGDVPAGNIYGRIYDPGNPANPNGAKLTNLHYEDDEDFMSGRTDSCWLIIDVEPEPIINKIGHKIRGVES